MRGQTALTGPTVGTEKGDSGRVTVPTVGTHILYQVSPFGLAAQPTRPPGAGGGKRRLITSIFSVNKTAQKKLRCYAGCSHED